MLQAYVIPLRMQRVMVGKVMLYRNMTGNVNGYKNVLLKHKPQLRITFKILKKLCKRSWK